MTKEELTNKCSYCKGIQDPESGEWVKPGNPQYNAYDKKYADRFSHVSCDPCQTTEREKIAKAKKEYQNNHNS